jgi:hypothetical protein
MTGLLTSESGLPTLLRHLSKAAPGGIHLVKKDVFAPVISSEVNRAFGRSIIAYAAEPTEAGGYADVS